MPCNSDYLAPTQRERELKRAAILLKYVFEKTLVPVPPWVISQSETLYPTNERIVPELCAAITALTPEQFQAIVYNAKDKTSRDLADWWEEHQAADAERLRNEEAARQLEKTRTDALNKLSLEEIAALGIKTK